jgi:hypothetical protein
MRPSFNRPSPRTTATEIEAGGLGIQRRTRTQPRLSAHWELDNDGQLTCRRDIN